MLTIRNSQMDALKSPGRPTVLMCPNTWIEVVLLDAEGDPVTGARYELELPDGSKTGGTLDENGKARHDGIVPGTCIVTFPEYHADDWQRVG